MRPCPLCGGPDEARASQSGKSFGLCQARMQGTYQRNLVVGLQGRSDPSQSRSTDDDHVGALAFNCLIDQFTHGKARCIWSRRKVERLSRYG